MHVVKASDYAWDDRPTPGMRAAELWPGTHGIRTQIVEMTKGTVYGRHSHPNYEQTFVVSGRLRLSEIVLGPGDYMLTEPGEVHDAEAIEDCVVLMSFGKPHLAKP